MNSILLLITTTNRCSATRRLICNGYRINSKNSIKQHFSTQQTPPPKANSSQKIIYSGVAIGLIGGYLLYNRISKSRSPQITSPISTTSETNEKIQPKPIDDLPEEIEYLIIGGGSAAFSALRTIRATQPLSKVIVVNEENSNPYMKSPLSKELWFAEPKLKKDLKFLQWNDRERSIYYAHDEFYYDLKQLSESKYGGTTVLRGYKVVKIDPYDQYVILNTGQTLKYGKCLIATGSKSIKSDLEANSSAEVKQRILNFGTVEDFKLLDKLVDQSKSFVIVGSEYLASELSCALTKRLEKGGEVVNVMETKGNLTSILPEYLSEWTSKCLKEEGVKQLTSTKVKSTDFKNNKVILNLSNGEQLTTDYVIIDNGAQPNIDLAETGGLEICPQTGGLLANAELQIRTNLWAAGDAVSFYDEKLGRRRIPHYDNALITGRLAGANMSGQKKIFWHQPIIWSDLGPKIGFEGVGVIDSKLPTISVFTKPDKNEQVDPGSLAIRLPNSTDDYYKGVVFYLGDGGVVKGVLMWNLFNKTQLARRIINENKSYEDLSDLARLFELHKNHLEIDE